MSAVAPAHQVREFTIISFLFIIHSRYHHHEDLRASRDDDERERFARDMKHVRDSRDVRTESESTSLRAYCIGFFMHMISDLNSARK